MCIFTGASLTANSAARENAVGAAGRNGSGGSSNRNNPSNNEEWQMKELVAKQTSHHSHHLHPHHHHQVVHHGVTPTPTVSLETHQTERGANTTIAATTHHLHEIDVSIFCKMIINVGGADAQIIFLIDKLI